LPVVTE